MFINIRLKKIFKIFFVVVLILMLLFIGISISRIYSQTVAISSNSDIIEITPNNYTYVLKAVHEDLDSYIGKTIKFTGFVYRVYDLKDTQFILARNMLISTDNKAVVVGFLCNYADAKSLSNNTWVQLTGTITKGNYHGDMPIIEVTEIYPTDCPTDEFVYPPDNSFVPTYSII